MLDPIAPQTVATAEIDTPGPGGHVLTVGAGQEFSNLSVAIAAASDNDVIAVMAGTYVDQSSYAYRNIVTAKNVTIEGVGGIAHLEMGPQGLANGKGLIDAQNGLTLKNFELSGASDQGSGGAIGSLYGNLAGVRVDSGNLMLDNVYIHDNQNGVLGGTTGSVVTIDHSAFVNNGSGDGLTHGIYIGIADSLTVTNSYFAEANVGHEIKSRAADTTITDNVIADGPTGTASYDIDLPNAGVATVTGNVIEKGPLAQNAGIIHYGGETQYAWANNSLSVVDNTIINDDPAYNVGVIWNQSAVNGLTSTASLTANTIYNVPSLGTGLIAASGNADLTVSAFQEPAYSTALPLADAPIISVPTGPLSLTLSRGGIVVSGGATGATIVDNAGGNTIASGAVGINLTENGEYATVTTSAGSVNTLTLADRNVLDSSGADVIAVSGLYGQFTASGASSIRDSNSSDFNYFYLDGAEVLTLAGSGIVSVGAAATAAVTDTITGGAAITIHSGGSVAVSQTELGGTASVTVASAAATVSASSSGVSVVESTTDTVAGAITFGGGAVSATSGAGADTYTFVASAVGTDTITGFRVGIDTLSYQGFGGASLVSVQVVGGNTILDLVNGTVITLQGVNALPPSKPSTAGTTTLTTAGQTLRGGAGPLTFADQAYGNTIIGGSGGVNGILGQQDTLTTAAGATDVVTVNRADLVTSAGNDTLNVIGNYSTIAATGAALVNLGAGPNTVTGGAGRLTVNDAGGNTVVGGSGGLTETVTGRYSSVTTAAGATDSIATSGGSTITSNGTDVLTIAGDYSQVTANGAAQISESGYNRLILNGLEAVTINGDAVAAVGAQSVVAATIAAGGSLEATVAAGGRLTVTQALQAGGSALVSVSGGAAQLSSASSGLSIIGDAAATAPLTVTFGAGVNSATDGAAPVTYTFVAGRGGGDDTIYGFRAGIDSFSFQGFSGSPVASWVIVGGSTVGVLTDGTSITVANAIIPAPAAPSVVRSPTTQVFTTINSTWTGTGTPAALIDASAGGNVFIGGAGGLTIRLAAHDTVSTQAGATDVITLGSSDVVHSAGGDTITIAGRYNVVTADGASRVTVTDGGNTVTGGAGHLTVTDTSGSSVVGGAGGVTALETGRGASISTSSGATNSITATDQTAITSAGNDTIAIAGDGSSVAASGVTTISETSGSNSFALLGQESLVAGGDAVIQAGAASQVTIRLSGGGSAEITRVAGASVGVIQSTASGISTTTVTGGAGTINADGGGVRVTTGGYGTTAITLGSAAATIQSLGDDTVTGGSGTVAITASNVATGPLTFLGGAGAATITAGSNGLDATAGTGTLTVQFGRGTATVQGGIAADVYQFIAGSGGGSDTIAGYRSGIDQLQFKGFYGNPVASQTVVGGSLDLVLGDTTRLHLVGVTHL